MFISTLPKVLKHVHFIRLYFVIIGTFLAFHWVLAEPLKSTAKSTLTPAISQIQLIPDSVKNQICRELSEDKKNCGVDDQVNFIHAYQSNNNQLVLFFYLKNKKASYHRGASLSVKLNSSGKEKGQWVTGSPFVGEPREVVHDMKGGLWMHAQFNSTGETPRLLYSQQGLDWVEVELPGESSRLRNLKKICFQGGTLLISLQSTDIQETKDSLKVESWRSSLDKLLSKVQPKVQSKVQPKTWGKVSNRVMNLQSCQVNKPKKNDWIIQRGETMTLFQNNPKKLTIKIDHLSTVENPVTKMVKEGTNTQNKPYAIQVGAYSNHQSVDQLKWVIKQKGFYSFTKIIDIKGKKIKKLYVGPYESRKVSAVKLKEIKSKLADNNRVFNSAFILKY